LFVKPVASPTALTYPASYQTPISSDAHSSKTQFILKTALKTLFMPVLIHSFIYSLQKFI